MRIKYIVAKYKPSEECVNTNNAWFIVEAMNEYIKDQTKDGHTLRT